MVRLFARSDFLHAAALAIALAMPSGLIAASRDPQPKIETLCELQPGPTRSVVRVIDAETVQLNDGSEVRLIGALAPRSPDMRPDAEPWLPEEEAVTALRALVLGRTVELAYAGRKRDRYGRLLAHLFLDRGGTRTWVQGELLRNGHARVYGLPGSYACMRELLAHEQVARDAQAGLWASAAYASRNARHARSLLRARNTYQIVVGEVARVKVTRNRTYLDFGKDWRRDFSVGVSAKTLRANPEWAKALTALEGRRVEVRGWIDYSYGPFINIEDPAQISVVEERLPGPTPPAGGATTSSEQRRAPRPKQKRPEPKLPGAFNL